MPMTVGFVGLGTIATTHLTVLAGFPDVEVAFGVDTDPGKCASFRGASLPRHENLGDALTKHEPDLVVVTAPTHAHAEVTREVLAGSDARVLVEKPLVHDLAALEELHSLGSTVDLRSRVFVAHHFAFSPEVRWSVDQLAANPQWGPVTGITTAFHDPYVADATRSFAALVSSWVDSGVNQLSVLARFVELVERGPVHESASGATSWCNVRFRSSSETGVALLRASWEAVASSKRTTLELGRSGVEIWLDHTAVTAFVLQDGQVGASLVNDGQTPRKVAHYRPLYESLLSGTPDPILGFDAAASIVKLLYGASGWSAG